MVRADRAESAGGLITDLHANGHSMLTIKENGDIVVSCQKKKILKATLDSFPGKAYWKELISYWRKTNSKGKSQITVCRFHGSKTK